MRETRSCHVYILLCADGTLYTGWTNDLTGRLAKHNARKGSKYIRSRTPVQLVYSEVCATKEDALSREYLIKRLSRRKKLDLIQSFRPAHSKEAAP
jgi:putative endonuclease